MCADHEPGALWRVRGVRLPNGHSVEEWWVAGGVWQAEPVEGARDLPGGWFLPGGLVDAHVHLTMNHSGHALPDGSDALVAANLAAHHAHGVLAVRDAGLAWGGSLGLETAGGLRVQRAGRLLAAPGRGYPQICAWVSPDELVAAALEDIRGRAQWVKIMGDFPGPDGNWFAAPPGFPSELVSVLVREAHAAGARVMAHTTGLAAAELVHAGVDSIEHGMVLDEELLVEMAQRGTAWSLTLATAMRHVGPLVDLPDPIGPYIRGALNHMRELLPRAVDLGVPLLAGTDELPAGAIAEEVAMLHRFGLTPAQALAAVSTGARAYLRLPTIEVGKLADVVTFVSDPREDVRVLAHPAAVLAGGVPVDPQS